MNSRVSVAWTEAVEVGRMMVVGLAALRRQLQPLSVNAHPAEGEEVGEFVASATDFGMSLTRSRDSTRSHEVSVQRGDRGVVRFMVHETFSSTQELSRVAKPIDYTACKQLPCSWIFPSSFPSLQKEVVLANVMMIGRGQAHR